MDEQHAAPSDDARTSRTSSATDAEGLYAMSVGSVVVAGVAVFVALRTHREWLQWGSWICGAAFAVLTTYALSVEAKADARRGGPPWRWRVAAAPWRLVRPVLRLAVVLLLVAITVAELTAVLLCIDIVITAVRSGAVPEALEIYFVGYVVALQWDTWAPLLLYMRMTRSMYRRNLNGAGIEPTLDGEFSTTLDHNLRRSLLYRVFLAAPIVSLLSWISVGYGLYRALIARSMKRIAELAPQRQKELLWTVWAKELSADEVRAALLELHGPKFASVIEDGRDALDSGNDEEDVPPARP